MSFAQVDWKIFFQHELPTYDIIPLNVIISLSVSLSMTIYTLCQREKKNYEFIFIRLFVRSFVCAYQVSSSVCYCYWIFGMCRQQCKNCVRVLVFVSCRVWVEIIPYTNFNTRWRHCMCVCEWVVSLCMNVCVSVVNKLAQLFDCTHTQHSLRMYALHCWHGIDSNGEEQMNSTYSTQMLLLDWSITLCSVLCYSLLW